MHNIYPFLTPNVSAELGFLLMGFLSKAEIPLPAPHLTCACVEAARHCCTHLTAQPSTLQWKKPALTADQPAFQHTKH